MESLLTLPNVLAGITLVALNAYVLFGGADFGGGVWDLFAGGERRAEQRELITDAIGPIWEANHVWLVLVVVLLFTCFPPAFAALSITLHIPLSLMLIGIVLRGSAFTFRSYGSAHDAEQRRWGQMFAIASLLTPVLLGISIGAIASGRVGEAMQLDHARGASNFVELYVAPWLTPFSVGVGVLALALFAFLAAVYLTLEARDERLREDFRVRALWSALAVFVVAFAVLLVALATDMHISAGLTRSAWAIPFHIATGLAAIWAIWALWARRFHMARVAAAAQVTLILWGWALGQYPYILPPTLTIGGAAAPERTLNLALWALALGATVLFPSLAYLFRIFKGRPEAFERME
ncbi:MAG TPA: cytochrome d ubiquinol oxidase subunit II [Gemmatimonadaceae bacterium]|nr:cytochrome d ubiquinol oxidase subunit II [Gemmatimonadaceae bacterium]